MAEKSVVSAQASVLTYNKEEAKWEPAGPKNGLSKVQLYKNEEKKTYRVVGRNLTSKEVNVNSMFNKSTMYHLASQTFHQWRDPRHVFGLNFPRAEDAQTFADAANIAIQELKAAAASTTETSQPLAPTSANGRRSTPDSAAANTIPSAEVSASHGQPQNDSHQQPQVPSPARRQSTAQLTTPPAQTTGVPPPPPGAPPAPDAPAPPGAPPPPTASTTPPPSSNAGPPRAASMSLMDQITAAKLNSTPKARPSEAPKREMSGPPSFADEMANKLKLRATKLAEAEQSGVSAEPVIPPPADNTATSPVPFSPATLRKAGKKTAPPPVISKRPVTGGHTPPVAPKVAKSISKPEICIDTSPKHSKTEGDHNTHGALAVQSGGTPSPFDFDAMKKSIMSEVREQVEEFTKDLLAGIESQIETMRPADSSSSI